ncbi:MAG: PPOX class F420-dependent oxidoreductase [Anaerolineales bacterium]|jgi:PPOX class probable F420-dependent enzyme
MSVTVPDSHKDLLQDETRAFAFLATSMKDGSPQVTPVWFDMDGERIRINTARGRVKEKNMKARRQVALAIIDPDDPYRYIQVRGRVVEIREAGAREHIDWLSEKYTGNQEYQNYRGETRVIFYIEPESVSLN